MQRYVWILPALLVMAAVAYFAAYYIVGERSRRHGRRARRLGEGTQVPEQLPDEPERGWLELELMGLGETAPEAETAPEDTAQAMPPEAGAQPEVEAQPERRRKKRARTPFSHTPHPMTRRDILPVLLITLIYGFVAFWGLGDRTAPQSFAKFGGELREITLDLGQVQDIAGVQYYTGLNTGDYSLRFSEDGVNWSTSMTLEQAYSELFKWRDVEMNGVSIHARYLQISTGQALWLGELALRDADWNLLPYTVSPGGEAICDEQEIVPEAPSYLNSMYFDEIYHGRTALEHLEGMDAYEISHPPLGKILIGIGIELFGMTPFGWRFVGTLLGVLMLPLLYIFIKNLFGKTFVAACGTIVFAFDFMHFVQTRIATIDTYGVLFILLMYYFMYRYLFRPYDAPLRKTLWPLFLSGLFFGLGAASKWTVIYGGAGLALLWLLRQVTVLVDGRRRGETARAVGKVAATCGFSVLFFLVVPAFVYLLSYIPYAKGEGLTPSLALLGNSEFYRLVWENQEFMFTYHSGLDATHAYGSPWWKWVLDLRPILYYLEYFDDGTKSAFGAFGNPLVWWTGIFAMLVMAAKVIRQHDRIALLILIGYLAQLLPWVFITRVAFIYHYFPNVLFIVLAISYLFSDLCQRRGRRGRSAVLCFTGGTVALFVFFYPVLTGLRVPMAYTNWLGWFAGSWPF